MKKIFSIFACCLLWIGTAWAENQAYAAYDEGTKTLTYYFDSNRSSHAKTVSVPFDDQNVFISVKPAEKIVIDPSFYNSQITKAESLFNYCKVYFGTVSMLEDSLRYVTSIDGLQNINTGEMYDFDYMFAGMTSLTSLDLSSFDTKNAEYMRYMFRGCASLQSLDLNSFDTKNARYMNEMFKGCKSLQSLDLSSFNTENVTVMASMFEGCESLKSVNLSSFNTANVTITRFMFSNCKSLECIDLYSFDMTKVTDMIYMFENCSSLKKIYCKEDWSSYNHHSIDATSMFNNCTSLVGGAGTKYNTEYPMNRTLARPDKGIEKAGYFTKKPKMYIAQGWLSNNPERYKVTFYYDSLDYARVKQGYVYDYNPDDIFFLMADKIGLAIIDKSMKRAPLTSTKYMFYDVDHGEALVNLTEIQGLENLNTSIITDMSNMFRGCSSLQSLDLSSFDVSNVELMESMFRDCKSLYSLDLNSFDISKVRNMAYIFANCKNLRTIYCGQSWNKSTTLTRSENMFLGCTKLMGGNGTAYDETKTGRAYACPGVLDVKGYFLANKKEIYTEYDGDTTLFYRCDANRIGRKGVTELYDPAKTRFANYHNKIKKAFITISMFDTLLTTTRNMFYGGTNSTDLGSLVQITGLPYLKTQNVTNMSQMFYNCYALTSIDLSNFNTEKVETMNSMFEGCSALTELNLRRFSMKNVESISYMFARCYELKTIYCDEDWSALTMYETSQPFMSCDNLVGKNGTAYSDTQGGKDYARPDEGSSTPGYFTAGGVPEYYTSFDGVSVLTYYYDGDRAKRPNPRSYEPENSSQIRFDGYADQIGTVKIDESFRYAKPTSLARMFYGGDAAHALTVLSTIEGLENINFSEVTDMSYMFAHCSNLSTVDLSAFNTEKVTNMNGMFIGCTQLFKLDLNGFKTSNVTDMRTMFAYCTSLKGLDISSFEMTNVAVASMFMGCAQLSAIYCDKDWSATLTDGTNMFSGCSALVGGNGTTCDGSTNTGIAYARPDKDGQEGYFTTGIYTEYVEATATLTYYCDDLRETRTGIVEAYAPAAFDNPIRFTGYANRIVTAVIDESMKNVTLTSLANMFDGGKDGNELTALQEVIGLDNINFTHVTNLHAMFFGCSALKSINFSGISMPAVTKTRMMFYGCSSLETVYCDADLSAATEAYNMFKGCTALVGSNGTKCNGTDNIEAAYARPDKDGQAGYFSDINALTSLKEQLNAIIQDLNALYDFAAQYVPVTETEMSNLAAGIEDAEDMYNDPAATIPGIRNEILTASAMRTMAISQIMSKGKATLKEFVGSKLLPNDNDACKQIVADKQALIDALEWDNAKSVTENIAILDPAIKQILADVDALLAAARTTTGFEIVESQKTKDNSNGSKAESLKVIRNGQLLIIRDGKTYNAVGTEVK